MANACPNNRGASEGSTILAQQLFLGASVNSFSSSIGWGGTSSSLNVELINDFGSFGDCYIANNVNLNLFPGGGGQADNHYYTCQGDACYIDETGQPYNPNRNPPPLKKMVPGKVYHALRANGLVSRYWTRHDPGFIANATLLDPNGSITVRTTTDANGNTVISPFRYNIIGTPVYFRYGYFTFGGIVESWDQNINAGPGNFSVNIRSPDAILEQSYVILNNYAGSIFANFSGRYGTPSNFTGGASNLYKGTLRAGNIPNVFNVYGFLESFGYGTAEKNDRGIPIQYIIKALSVLTSSQARDLGQKSAFSPFGRIIAPIPLTDDANPIPANFRDYSFGLCDTVRDVAGEQRCEFILDISELPLPPTNIRLESNSDVISILDLIRQVCDKTGRDFYTTLIRKNNLNVIKIKTVNRTIPIPTNSVTSILDNLLKANIKTTTASVGQEKNTATPKVLYIGANQQRLYQAKSYLLGYSQSNFIYHPYLGRFIDIKDINSVKDPSVFSTRNLTLSQRILGQDLSDIFSQEQRNLGANPDAIDTPFQDTEVGGLTQPVVGNYVVPTYKYNDTAIARQATTRYIPLWKNPISPFFGYIANERVDIDAAAGSNTFRYIRPVYYDTWTGQLTVAMNIFELPELAAGRMPSVYTARSRQGSAPVGAGLGGQSTTVGSGNSTQTPPTPGQVKTDKNTGTNTTQAIKSSTRPRVAFTITETEMRAAIAGWENYLAYCLAKLNFNKPDLFVMLVDLYTRLGKLFGNPVPPLEHSPGAGLQGASQPAGSSGAAGGAKQNTGKPIPAYKQLNINFNIFLNHEFVKDLQILSNFIASIGNEFYGKKYLVRMPELRAYKDSENPDIKIPVMGNNISVYQGSGKIFFNYETTDGAWEEVGNVIDGEVAVGSQNSYKFLNSNNQIRPLLGYNANPNIDFVTQRWCSIEQSVKKRLLGLYNDTATPSTSVSIDPEDGSPPASYLKSNQGYIIAQLNKYGWNIENCSGKIAPSLDLGNLTDYVLTTVPGQARDAFNNNVPAQRQKLYLPVNVNSEFAFLDPINLIGPMAIVDAGDGVDLAISSHSYVADPNLTVVSNAAIEDLAFLEKAQQNSGWSAFLRSSMKDYNSSVSAIKEILRAMIVPADSNGFLIPEGDTSNQQAKHKAISPKKAQPIFAGIPIKSNIACYGPWTNYPSLANQSLLFPGISNTRNLLEQLISDVKIQKDDNLSPWNYGGMAFLDQAVVYDIQNYLSYQTRLEQGSISLGSLPVFGLAGNLTLKTTDSDWHGLRQDTFLGFPYHYLIYPFDNGGTRSPDYNGLAISSLNISVSSSNINTTYSFRTYSPKLGLFNKENADRVKEFANSVSSFNRKIANVSQKLENSIRKQLDTIFDKSKTNRGSTNLSRYESEIYASSPTQMLIGTSSYYVPLQTGVISHTGIATSWAGMYVPDEAVAELAKEYRAKAVMSMDGLFSPVSLYPTENNSTFPISSRAVTSSLRSRSITCPKCNGTGKIRESYLKGAAGTPQETDFPCPLCAKSKPFGFDHTIKKTTIEESEEPEINCITLNPIGLPTGEFRNKNAQSGDAGRYGIRVVGRSDAPPTGNRSMDSFTNINDPLVVNQNFGEIDQSYKTIFNTQILNNHRFFAFRGPMMLHGWGYDTDGFPVPNEADQPKEFDSEGRPKRCFLNNLGENDPAGDGGFLPTSSKQLGDIIGKGWVKDGEGWSRKPTNKFHINWMERPDLWPVGPIDLRWDYERKVWVAGGGGCANTDPPYIIANARDVDLLSSFSSLSNSKNKKCSYKLVYGVLEQDMTRDEGVLDSYPARAFLDDLEYGLEPLPENIRRLIYIIDRTGYTAPRGAKILLRFNTDNGFYEPVSKQQYIVFGKIRGGNSAIVELDYIPGYKSGDSKYKSTVNFKNPLGIKVSSGASVALVYNNRNWNVIGINITTNAGGSESGGSESGGASGPDEAPPGVDNPGVDPGGAPTVPQAGDPQTGIV